MYLVWAPVHAGNGLGRDCDILEERDRANHTLLLTFVIFLDSTVWIGAVCGHGDTCYVTLFKM